MEGETDIIVGINTEKGSDNNDETIEFLDGHEYRKAFEILSKRAEDGDNLSRCRMGVMYYEGLGIDKRPLKAFELIKESYNPDCPETVFQLGKCHFEGIGTKKNEELGFEMIISAAEVGYSSAENYMASAYYKGK